MRTTRSSRHASGTGPRRTLRRAATAMAAAAILLAAAGCGTTGNEPSNGAEYALCLGLSLNFERTAEVAAAGSGSTPAEQRDALALLNKFYGTDFVAQAGPDLETQAEIVTGEVARIGDGTSTPGSRQGAVDAFDAIAEATGGRCS